MRLKLHISALIMTNLLAFSAVAQTFAEEVTAAEVKLESNRVWNWLPRNFPFKGDGVNFQQIANNKHVQVNERLMSLNLAQRVYVQDEKNRKIQEEHERSQAECAKRKQREPNKIIFCGGPEDGWMRNAGWRATYTYDESTKLDGRPMLSRVDETGVNLDFGIARTVKVIRIIDADLPDCELWARKRVWLDEPTIPAVVAMEVSGRDYLEFETCWAVGENGPVPRYSYIAFD